MTLSSNKLQELLSSKGLSVNRFYTVNGLCVYVDVFCSSTFDSFMLYIPSKYDIKPSGRIDTFSMEYLDVREDGYIPGDYGREPNDIALEKAYDEIDITEENKGDMVEYLEEHYNRPVALKNVSESDLTELRDVFRQLRRLKFCVQSLKYKLCISFKKYICCIRRDDTFEGYIVKGGSDDNRRRFFVTIDLESLYSKLDTVAEDITTIRDGVYAVLDKNHLKHTKCLSRMMDSKIILADSSVDILRKKAAYAAYISKFKLLLEELAQNSESTSQKIYDLREGNSSNTGIKGFHSDMERGQKISKLDEELTRLNKLKKEVRANIAEVNAKYENIVLKVDKILFDNSVMLDAMLKNLNDLENM